MQTQNKSFKATEDNCSDVALKNSILKAGKMVWGWGRWDEECFRSRKYLPETVLERWEYCGPFK